MKKIILIISILFSVSMADSVLLVKKGWQLIGSSTDLDSMLKFRVKASVDRNISVMKEASKLHNFTMIEEMEAYIKERANLYASPVSGIEPLSEMMRFYESQPQKVSRGEVEALKTDSIR